MNQRIADQRVLRGRAATLTWQNVDSDGTAAAPAGTVTVHVQAADGTDIVAAGTATTGTGAAPRTYALTASQTANLGLLTVTWTDAGDASADTTLVEIVGGYYFSIADARASDASLADPLRYADADILAARREVEDEFEAITGVAFVPRYRRVTLDGTGTGILVLPDTRPRRIVSVRVYSSLSAPTYTALTAAELADLTLDDGIIVRRSMTNVAYTTSLAWGAGNIVVEYEHGWDRPPAEVKRAALTRLRHRLNFAKTGIPDRATSFTFAEGGGGYRLDQAGIYKTGIPDVDAVLARYSERVPGFA